MYNVEAYFIPIYIITLDSLYVNAYTYIMKKILIILFIIIIAAVAFFIFKPDPAPKPPKEVPCSELRWMRDLPQQRCKEYWRQRNIEEGFLTE